MSEPLLTGLLLPRSVWHDPACILRQEWARPWWDHLQTEM